MTPDEVALLQQTVREIEFSNSVLEIGTAAGGSLVAICAALRQTEQAPPVVCIDPMTYFSGQLETVHRNLTDNGFSKDRVEFRRAKAERLYRHCRETGERFDFILIDGNHKYRHVVMDLQWSDLLSPNGRIALHDYTDYFRGVKRAVDSFMRMNPYYRVIEHTDSLIVIGRDSAQRDAFRDRETPLHHVASANLLTVISQNLRHLGLDFLKLS